MEILEIQQFKFRPFCFVYVLELQDNKYYVGTSNNPNQRIKEHFDGRGSTWTKLHNPVKVLELYVGELSDEKSKTLELMAKYGWENVRGYCWSQVNLAHPPKEIKQLLIANEINQNKTQSHKIKLSDVESIYSYIKLNELDTYVYILKLEEDKYYVGCNSTKNNNFQRHFEGDGPPWTQTYKPIEMMRIVTGDKKLEKEITLLMMKKYGWENVRGYAWSQLHMKNPPRELRYL